MPEAEKRRFYASPASQSGLFGRTLGDYSPRAHGIRALFTSTFRHAAMMLCRFALKVLLATFPKT
jgi:hypothetical protein